VVLRLRIFQMRGISMGIEVWIESRVGKLDPTDAVLKSRLEN
jgi:hypothetical protein